MNINFYLPGLTSRNLQLSVLFKRIMDTHPEMFYDNFKIGAFYGCFGTAIWNGGRMNERYQPSLTEMKETIALLRELDIPIRYTYTNCFLKEEHLYDTFCNKTLELLADNKIKGDGIIVVSDILEKYLRERYPDFDYIASTTKYCRGLDYINKATEAYDMVVLDVRDAVDFELISKIKDKQKVEILLNYAADKDCKFIEVHGKEASAINLFELEHTTIVGKCPRTISTMQFSFQDMLRAKYATSIDDLFNKYIKMGFSNFKISGRGAPLSEMIDTYLYYMCKPEYIDTVKAETKELLK